MGKLEGRIAWVTGAGSGIGEAAALALAGEGARLVLTGRRETPLVQLARRIGAAGGEAHAKPGDVTDPKSVADAGRFIQEKFGRLDILVNNAGANIVEREWNRLAPAAVAEVIRANLESAFYCVTVALPFMRKQKDGILIHTASMAGRFIAAVSGAAYTAAKHGVVAMSHSINMEECANGIRSTAICPGEVSTPILDKRAAPPTKEDRARMLQPEDCGDLIRYVACLPPHICINEVLITPTWNRGYIAAQMRN